MLSAIWSMLFIGVASAANVTLYYSPTCPHCHHARDFIAGELVYEYPTITAEAVNVMDGHYPAFQEALKKCEFESGGVPVIVINDKCFQGYAEFMNQELRDAAAIGLTDAEKEAAAANLKAYGQNPEKFKADNASRANTLVERGTADAQKKNSTNPVIYFYILLAVLVLGLGFVVIKSGKKKK